MTIEEADRFIQRTTGDEAFLASIESLGEDSNAVFEFVRAEGFDCTPEEIKDAFFEHYAAQMSADQLEAIAGGISTSQALGIGIGGGAAAIGVGVGVAAGAIAAGAV